MEYVDGDKCLQSDAANTGFLQGGSSSQPTLIAMCRLIAEATVTSCLRA